ncbi:uncharacterized protein LOC144732178 isoform X3 [Lampetra planeri]
MKYGQTTPTTRMGRTLIQQWIGERSAVLQVVKFRRRHGRRCDHATRGAGPASLGGGGGSNNNNKRAPRCEKSTEHATSAGDHPPRHRRRAFRKSVEAKSFRNCTRIPPPPPPPPPRPQRGAAPCAPHRHAGRHRALRCAAVGIADGGGHLRRGARARASGLGGARARGGPPEPVVRGDPTRGAPRGTPLARRTRPRPPGRRHRALAACAEFRGRGSRPRAARARAGDARDAGAASRAGLRRPRAERGALRGGDVRPPSGTEAHPGPTPRGRRRRLRVRGRLGPPALRGGHGLGPGAARCGACLRLRPRRRQRSRGRVLGPRVATRSILRGRGAPRGAVVSRVRSPCVPLGHGSRRRLGVELGRGRPLVPRPGGSRGHREGLRASESHDEWRRLGARAAQEPLRERRRLHGGRVPLLVVPSRDQRLLGGRRRPLLVRGPGPLWRGDRQGRRRDDTAAAAGRGTRRSRHGHAAAAGVASRRGVLGGRGGGRRGGRDPRGPPRDDDSAWSALPRRARVHGGSLLRAAERARDPTTPGPRAPGLPPLPGVRGGGGRRHPGLAAPPRTAKSSRCGRTRPWATRGLHAHSSWSGWEGEEEEGEEGEEEGEEAPQG